MVCYRTYRAGLHAGSDPQLPTYSKAPLCEVRGPLRTAMSIERGLELVQSPTVVQTVFSLARPCRCLHLFGRSIFPGLKVLGLVVFPFTSVLQKTQSLSQSRVLFPRNWHVPDSHVTLA